MTDRILRCLAVALILLLGGCSTATAGGNAKSAPAGYPEEEIATMQATAADSEAVAASDRALEAPAAMPAPAPPPPPAAGAVAQAPASTAQPDALPDVPPPNPAAVASPLLIYTAELHLAVYETAKAIEKVEKLTHEAGGYLVSRDDQSIVVRVPAGKFQGALGEITDLGDVLHRQVQVRDVTAEYHDLEIRLRNAEAVLARLTDLLQRAASVKDALAVEAELARVAGEVESLKGRLKLMRELVAFSTITIRFSAPAVETVEPHTSLPFPWLDELGLGSLLRF